MGEPNDPWVVPGADQPSRPAVPTTPPPWPGPAAPQGPPPWGPPQGAPHGAPPGPQPPPTGWPAGAPGPVGSGVPGGWLAPAPVGVAQKDRTRAVLLIVGLSVVGAFVLLVLAVSLLGNRAQSQFTEVGEGDPTATDPWDEGYVDDGIPDLAPDAELEIPLHAGTATLGVPSGLAEVAAPPDAGGRAVQHWELTDPSGQYDVAVDVVDVGGVAGDRVDLVRDAVARIRPDLGPPGISFDPDGTIGWWPADYSADAEGDAWIVGDQVLLIHYEVVGSADMAWDDASSLFEMMAASVELPG